MPDVVFGSWPARIAQALPSALTRNGTGAVAFSVPGDGAEQLVVLAEVTQTDALWEIADAIRGAHARFAGSTVCAVRSSATAEDQPALVVEAPVIDHEFRVMDGDVARQHLGRAGSERGGCCDEIIDRHDAGGDFRHEIAQIAVSGQHDMIAHHLSLRRVNG